MDKRSPSAKRPMGRPREYDLNSALDRAIPMFRERGYSGASVEALQTATGLTAGSLYKAFKSKREFFAAAYHRYVEARRVIVADHLRQAATARDRIAATLHADLDAAAGDEGRRGCMVVAGLIEASTLDASLRDAVATTLADNRAGLVALLEEGRRDGSIRADLPVEACADLLLALLQGLRATGKLRDPVDPDGLVTLTLKTLN
jgi:AcrR family transcriptional regulator